MVSAGDAILIPSGPNGHHLFIVLNNPKPLPGYGTADHCVLVNISTIDPSMPYDSTLVLQPGDHPFINSPSYCYFRGARVDRASHLDECIGIGKFIMRPPPFTPQQVSAIKQGLLNSPKVSREFKRLPI